MNTPTLKQEKHYLITSAVRNVLVGCVGITVSAISSSQTISLDNLFNPTYFVIGLFTVKKGTLIAGGDGGIVDILFTADRRRGGPFSSGGIGETR